jgi:uncharacterized membrane protein
MNGPIKILAHPLHPMLVVFPLGLLSSAVIFDIIALVTNNSLFHTVSFWMIAAGLIGGLLAAVVGFLDWSGLKSGTRAKSVGGWHGLGNLTIVLLFAASWWLRRGVPNNIPSTTALILSLLGAGLALVTGWLGGEMVYQLGVAVDEMAHENAPNSLFPEKPKTPQPKKPVHKSTRP